MPEVRIFISEAESRSVSRKSKELQRLYWDRDDYYRSGNRIARVRYLDGKRYIVTGSGTEKTRLEDEGAEDTLRARGFEPWFTIRRSECSVRLLHGVEFFLEKLESLGWSIEVEAETREAVIENARAIGFNEDRLEWRPLQRIVRRAQRGERSR